MGWKIGDHITLRGTDAGHMQMEFIIIGTIENKRYPNTFMFRRDYLMESRKANGQPDRGHRMEHHRARRTAPPICAAREEHRRAFHQFRLRNPHA